MDDRCEIASCIGALAVHVDARQWDELANLFAARVTADYTSLFGGEAQTTPREQLIQGWRQLLPGFTRTTHVIGTPRIVVAGNTAHASASVIAWHFIEEPLPSAPDFWRVGGCYEMLLRREEGAWRIASLMLARAWAEGNLELPRIAAERVAAANH